MVARDQRRSTRKKTDAGTHAGDGGHGLPAAIVQAFSIMVTRQATAPRNAMHAIDLRSDTVTRPTAAMRAAMVDAGRR